MSKKQDNSNFETLNNGYSSVFKTGRMSIGLVVPIERYDSHPVPSMDRHIERVQLAESLGFKAVWLRDVPFNVPSFGDAGQPFDPFVYLGLLAKETKNIALGVASIILPLRHPAHVTKAAATIDVLSGGRLLLGVASGDRPEEYPAMNINYDDRGKLFRESFEYINKMQTDYPILSNVYGNFTGDIDMLPKPVSGKVPLLITGGSQQSPEWIAKNGDGWMIYPRDLRIQTRIIKEWRKQLHENGRSPKPLVEPLYVDLTEDPDTLPRPIHLGLRLGANQLSGYLKSRKQIGVNHVAINLRFNKVDIETTMKRLADEVLPEFHK